MNSFTNFLKTNLSRDIMDDYTGITDVGDIIHMNR
jgi:hypothetical protein